MKTSRRDFLKSIAVSAITFATGFAMTPVRVKEPEPTDAERRYGEMLSGEQDHIDLVYTHLDSSNRIWAVSSQAEVYFSDDWGVTWNLQEAGTIESVNDDGSVSVRLDDATAFAADYLDAANELDDEMRKIACQMANDGKTELEILVILQEFMEKNIKVTIPLDFDGWMYAKGTV